MQNYFKSSTSKRNLLSIFTVGVAVIIIVVFLIYKHEKRSTFIPSTNPSHTATKLQTGTESKQQSIPTPNQSTEKSTSGNTVQPATVELKAPNGSFVSNHKPSLGGNDSPSSEQSMCNTTPGATCEIVFTNGSDTKILSAQTADSSGVVYWNWDVKNAHFSVGSWKITAIAKLNDKTLSTSDQLNLDVQQ